MAEDEAREMDDDGLVRVGLQRMPSTDRGPGRLELAFVPQEGMPLEPSGLGLAVLLQ